MVEPSQSTRATGSDAAHADSVSRTKDGAEQNGPSVSHEVAGSLLWKTLYAVTAAGYYASTMLELARHMAWELPERQPRARPRQRFAPDDIRIVQLLTLKDKISFVLGVANLVLVTWSLGAGPLWFYRLYSFEAVVVIAYRLYRYRQIKQHYYLLDFCYWVNILLLAYIWLLPSNYRLFQAVWMFSTGPLAWSVAAFRNSMVFHSSDKVTSVLVHLLPGWACWTIRWWIPPSAGFRYCELVTDDLGGAHCATGLVHMFSWAAWPYLLWLAFYYVFVFVVHSKKVNEGGYQTLYGWLMSSPGLKHHPLRRAVEAVRNPWLQKLLYMGIHMVFSIFTGTLSILYWRYFALNTFFLVAMFGLSLWNGGTFYIDHFSKQYQRILRQSVVHAPNVHRDQATAIAARAADLVAAATDLDAAPLASAATSSSTSSASSSASESASEMLAGLIDSTSDKDKAHLHHA